MKYTLIDGFSGAGGLLIGLLNAGYEAILSFDNDKTTIETQRINRRYFNHKAIYADINKLLAEDILASNGLKRGDLFLFAGGPPCQGFSVQRIGQDNDERNNLIFSYVKMVDKLLPKFILMENVPGIQGNRGKSMLNQAISMLENLGYAISKKVLDAEDYGVPQRRRRVFVVGVRKNIYHKPFEFPDPTTPEGNRVTVRNAIGNLPEPPLDGTDHPKITHHRRDRLTPMNIRRIQALKPGQGREHLPDELLADCHKLSANKIGHRNVYGRMSWDSVAPTITARFDSFTRGLFGHPQQDRSVSLREGALLQTFPRDFNFSGSKVEIARQIGNAVPVKLAEIIGKQIISYYKSRPTK